jgi:F0F1-type ATP synthase membrane subunit b/b'
MNIFPDFTLLIIVVLFFVNYLIVRTFFLKPINRILTDRETDISSAQKRFEEALGQFNEATSAIEAKLHQARREASNVRESRRVAAVSHRQQLIERTRSEAEKTVVQATSSLKKDVVAAREKIVRDAEALARMAVERIIGRKIA